MPLTLEKNVITKAFADQATLIAAQQLEQSSSHKEPRMAQVRKYEDLYFNKTEKKLRIQFDVTLPVMSGMIDTILANVNDPIRLKFVEQEPADYLSARKITAAWEIESSSQRPGAKWDQKDRWDKRLAMFYGRGVKKYSASSDGGRYESSLEVVDPNDFHCEPKGGGHLENHLFCGQEGIFKTREQLITSAQYGAYDALQVEQLIGKVATPGYKEEVATRAQGKFNRFKALGLDAESHNYVGQELFHLVEWAMTYKGERWYLLFDPITCIWVRFERLTDVFSSGLYPWVSWATHEDPKVFWSKSFADDIYPVAMSISTLYNQELTNRQKKNYGARAYDKDMFPNVEALDVASHRPDALVPADTKGGTRKISEGIYKFEIEGLNGTIDLIGWSDALLGRHVGVTPGSQGTAEKDKKVSVYLGDQEEVSKRFTYRSASYSEAWGEIGLRYIQGLNDHLGEGLAIQLLGENGLEWDRLKRLDLKMKREPEIKIISSTKQNADNQRKVERKAKAWELLKDSPNINQKWKAEQILRDIGDYPDSEIALAMDVQNYGNKELMAEASAAIQDIIRGREPQLNYDADTAFMQKIVDFALAHRVALGMKKYTKMMDYVDLHTQIATENMGRRAMALRSQQMAGAGAAGAQGGIGFPAARAPLSTPLA